LLGPFPVRLADEDSVTEKTVCYALVYLRAAWYIDRSESWDALCPDVATEIQGIRRNVLIRNSGLVYRNSVDLCRPTESTQASPNALMLTSAKDPR
jgi:hypothetical protein